MGNGQTVVGRIARPYESTRMRPRVSTIDMGTNKLKIDYELLGAIARRVSEKCSEETVVRILRQYAGVIDTALVWPDKFHAVMAAFQKQEALADSAIEHARSKAETYENARDALLLLTAQTTAALFAAVLKLDAKELRTRIAEFERARDQMKGR